MLIRSYIVHSDMGNDFSPFIIQNAPVYRKYRDDTDCPTKLEVAASGLLVRPIYVGHCNVSDTERVYREHLHSVFVDVDLPEEIKDALCGQPSRWKAVRCSLGMDGVLFIVVDEENFTGDDGCIESVEDSIACGCAWATLKGISFEIEITVQHADLGQTRYVLARMLGRYSLTEYDNHDRILRHSEVQMHDDRFDDIYVTEYL